MQLHTYDMISSHKQIFSFSFFFEYGHETGARQSVIKRREMARSDFCFVVQSQSAFM